MTYEDFRRLILDAIEFDSLDAYVADVGGSVSPSVSDADVLRLLTNCYTYGHSRNATTIRNITGLSKAAFAREYNIPQRTLENWESHVITNARQAPSYVLDLLAYAVISKPSQN